MDREKIDSDKALHIIYVCVTLVIVILSIVLILTTTSEQTIPLKVGCVFSGSISETGWNSTNYRGISAVCESDEIELRVRENVPEEEMACLSAVNSLISENCGMIFLTSYGYEQFADRLLSAYPGVKFCVTGSDNADSRLIYYLGRMYETRYLSGIIAGLTTKTNVIGYVAAMPNNEVNRGINAFALGARKINPDVRVKVIFTGSWDDANKERAAVEKLNGLSADVIAYQQNQENVPRSCDALGIDFIGTYELMGEYSAHYLTSIDCRWEKIYGRVISDYRNRRVDKDSIYWAGLSDEAVYLTDYSENVSVRARYEVMFAEEQIKSGFNVFSGEIYDNTGAIRCDTNESLGDRSLIYDMNWFAEGVEIL